MGMQHRACIRALTWQTLLSFWLLLPYLMIHDILHSSGLSLLVYTVIGDHSITEKSVRVRMHCVWSSVLALHMIWNLFCSFCVKNLYSHATRSSQRAICSSCVTRTMLLLPTNDSRFIRDCQTVWISRSPKYRIRQHVGDFIQPVAKRGMQYSRIITFWDNFNLLWHIAVSVSTNEGILGTMLRMLSFAWLAQDGSAPLSTGILGKMANTLSYHSAEALLAVDASVLVTCTKISLKVIVQEYCSGLLMCCCARICLPLA